MRAQDSKPSRLLRAKKKAAELTEQLFKSARKVSSLEIGIIVFAGESYIFCPLTSDKRTLLSFIKALSTELISSQGSELFRSLELAFGTLGSEGRYQTVILFSDGEDLANTVYAQTPSSFIDEKHRLISYGFGTSKGSPIPSTQGRFILDKNGEIVISRLQKEKLAILAESFGGFFIQDERGTEDILEIDRFLFQGSQAWGEERSKKQEKNPLTSVQYNEITPWIALGALLLLVGGFVIAHLPSWISPTSALIFVTIIMSSLLPLSIASAQSAYQGAEYYKNKQYKEAAETFKELVKRNREKSKLQLAYGNSLYKAKKFKKAARTFNAAALAAETESEKESALYNQGMHCTLQKTTLKQLKHMIRR